ncbi:MAG: hypothetical protein LBN34_03200 [Clostridiales Family XIII bacterium]|jgi:hypothetical protein|nr:hypothetical protein [Clostridiales Family XIII bacterium]
MRNDTTLTALRLFVEEEPKILDWKIEDFSCARDPDVERFLKNDALRYESEGYGRTYLYTTHDKGQSRIMAFFTVAITSTDFRDISKSRKRKVLHSKPGRDGQDFFGGILVGQLGRADGFDSTDINGQEMLNGAEIIIEMGREHKNVQDSPANIRICQLSFFSIENREIQWT